MRSIWTRFKYLIILVAVGLFVVAVFSASTKLFQDERMTITRQVTALPVTQGLKVTKLTPSREVQSLWDDFNAKYHKKWGIRWNDQTGFPQQIYGYHTEEKSGVAKQIAFDFLSDYSSFLGVNTANLELIHSTQIPTSTYFYYQQSLQDIQVEGAKVTVQVSNKGEVLFFKSTYFPNIPIGSTNTQITSDHAIEIIKNDLGSSTIYRAAPESHKVIYPDESRGLFVLTWKISVATERPLGSWFYFVDAQTGNIIEKQNRLVQD